MKKDIAIKGLLEQDDIFADIANVNLFGGRQVLHSEDLEEVPTETGYKGLGGEYHAMVRDCFRKVYKRGRCIGYIGYEAQTDRNNVMPIRDMGYAYTAYMKQIHRITAENNRKGQSAFAKVLHDEQRLLPVVTCILYFGTKAWDYPLRLSDILDIPNEEQIFWTEMTGDYRIHVISLVNQPQEIRKRYQSDFRIIADYLAYYDDEKGLIEEWTQSRQILIHPEQLLDMLVALSNDKRMRAMREALLQIERKEETNMCLLMDIVERDYMMKGLEEGRAKGLEEGRKEGRKEGREQGRQEGIRGAVQLLQRLGLDEREILEQISRQFSLPIEAVKTFL
ncbi:MAG: hypothetical protein NC089_05690 [Bacteroides sp.]|nr:hypothetical protein [Bacteroides sp.]MCM1549019.1 hypothetical protein [Clostridium sp.]